MKKLYIECRETASFVLKMKGERQMEKVYKRCGKELKFSPCKVGRAWNG